TGGNTMTIEELLARECIRHTLACYNIAGDRLRIDEFVAVFTEDAVLESDGLPEAEAFCHIGRAAIHRWVSGWQARTATAQHSARQPSFVRHHLATSVIEFPDAETADVRTYWSAYTDIGPDHCGQYLDRFRSTGERWLIAHRRVRLDWRS